MATAEMATTTTSVDFGTFLPDQTSPPNDVFISYSHKDNEWVRGVLLPRLQDAGLKVLIDDRDFDYGAMIQKEISETLGNVRRVILVMSPDYFESRWTEFEYTIIATLDPVGRKRRMLPILHRKCQIPPALIAFKYADLTDPETFEEVMGKVLRSLARGAGAEARPLSRRPPAQERAPAEQDAQEARAGIAALADLVRRRPEVREAVAAYEPAFQAASRQVDLIGEYKGLHEWLHRLKDACEVIDRDRRRVRGDPAAWEILEFFLLQEFRGTLEELLNLAGRVSFAASEGLLRRKMQRYGEELQAAVGLRDPNQLDAALEGLAGEIGKHFGRFNTRLVTASQNLEQSALVEVLEDLGRALDGLGLDKAGPSVQKFRSGVASLGQLLGKLQRCTAVHDTLQQMEEELLPFAPRLGPGLAKASLAEACVELRQVWPELRTQLDPFHEEDWMDALRNTIQALDKALSGPDPTEARLPFIDFLGRLARCFARVDNNLLALCGELQKVGQPLAVMAEI